MLQAIDNYDSLNPHPDEAPADPAVEPRNPTVEPVYSPNTAPDPDPEMPNNTETDS